MHQSQIFPAIKFSINTPSLSPRTSRRLVMIPPVQMDKSKTFFDCRSDMFIAEETEDFGAGKDFFERVVDEAYKVDFGVFDTIASNDFNEDLHCATYEFWGVGEGDLGSMSVTREKSKTTLTLSSGLRLRSSDGWTSNSPYLSRRSNPALIRAIISPT